jgi:hypothetical protein
MQNDFSIETASHGDLDGGECQSAMPRTFERCDFVLLPF